MDTGTKEIKINKQTGKQEQKVREIPVDDLTRAKEFSNEELAGVINLSINQYIQDFVSLEIQLRTLREIADGLRGKEKTEEAFGKLAEVKARQENLERQIKQHRQVRDEILDGRIKI